MSPHLIQSAAKAQMDDRLRSAEHHRRATHARARRSAPAPRSARRLGLRSLRAALG